ncbi:MAG TPA: hypothetical protein PKA06_04835 [Gemmatales bacterium]|nr:hypothetical protein [Gemmatales bacterium]
MQRISIFGLVLLQVFVSLLGQGALSRCLRTDGSQHIVWTGHCDCHHEQSLHHPHHQAAVPQQASPISLQVETCQDQVLWSGIQYVTVKPLVFPCDSIVAGLEYLPRLLHHPVSWQQPHQQPPREHGAGLKLILRC